MGGGLKNDQSSRAKKQAIEKLEEALTQLWGVNLFLWSYKGREKVLEAWNLAFDVKEILESELEKNKEG